MKKQIALMAAVVIGALGAGLAVAQDTTGGAAPTVVTTPGVSATPGKYHHHHIKKNVTPTVTPTGN